MAITGQVARSGRGSEFHKEMDLERVFGDVCAYQAIIETPEQMPPMAEIAIQKALTEHFVTMIHLPADVIGEDLPSEHFTHPLIHELPRTAPSAAQVAKAAAILGDGKRVTIFCGIGCRDARDQVLSLAESLRAPIVHTLRAKDIFDTGENPVVGMTGLIGNPAGYHAVEDCDLIFLRCSSGQISP